MFHRMFHVKHLKTLFHVKQSYIYTKIFNNSQNRPKNTYLLCFHYVSQYVSRETQQNIVSRETIVYIQKYLIIHKKDLKTYICCVFIMFHNMFHVKHSKTLFHVKQS